MAKRRFWTPAEDRKLRKLYPRTPETVIAKRIGRSVPGVANRAFKLGLCKAPDYIPPSRIKAGSIPWNKGLKGVNGMSETRFTKGNRPHNSRPIGSTRYNKEGHVLVKVAEPNTWRRLDELAWEERNGPLDPQSFLRRKGDSLIPVNRADNMRLNSYLHYPKELARLIQLRGALNRQINKRSRNA